MVLGFGIFNLGIVDLSGAVSPARKSDLNESIAYTISKTVADVPSEMIRRGTLRRLKGLKKE